MKQRCRWRSLIVAALYERRVTKASTVIDRRYSLPLSYWVLPLILLALLTAGCALNEFAPPPVSPVLAAKAQRDGADSQTLSRGRSLFVSRCLECHTLPSVTKHSPDQWPHLVTLMSGRANLSASEQDAITAYLRAASITMAPLRQE